MIKKDLTTWGQRMLFYSNVYTTVLYNSYIYTYTVMYTTVVYTTGVVL